MRLQRKNVNGLRKNQMEDNAMSKRTKEEVKAELAKARIELGKLEARVDAKNTTRGAEDCSCNNPGCSGVEVVTYGVAVGASFAGGIS